MDKPAVFVVFGGTGDLAKKKLAPAFSALLYRKQLPLDSHLIGIARRKMTDAEYKQFLVGAVSDEKMKKCIEATNIHYLPGNFDDSETFSRLRELLNAIDVRKKSLVFYLATSFKFFEIISQHLSEVSLCGRTRKDVKVAFEKPFGESKKSAKELEKCLLKFFREEQVFHVDHYLSKNTIMNIYITKFLNPIVYESLHRELVDRVEIVVDEDVGVGSRAGYYNNAGAIKDMIQSHLIQVLSLLLSDRPDELSPAKISEQKLKVMKSLHVDKRARHVLGQYKSYKRELKSFGLEDRGTETFARVWLECHLRKWKGVKIMLQTGKKLEKKRGFIKVVYRRPQVRHAFKHEQPNELVFHLYPHENVELLLNTLNPIEHSNLFHSSFLFCKECVFGPNTIDAYQILLLEILNNRKDLFASSKEIIEAWRVVEEFDELRNSIPLVYYKDSTPSEKIA